MRLSPLVARETSGASPKQAIINNIPSFFISLLLGLFEKIPYLGIVFLSRK
jgi:hypothetical protein